MDESEYLVETKISRSKKALVQSRLFNFVQHARHSHVLLETTLGHLVLPTVGSSPSSTGQQMTWWGRIEHPRSWILVTCGSRRQWGSSSQGILVVNGVAAR